MEMPFSRQQQHLQVPNQFLEWLVFSRQSSWDAWSAKSFGTQLQSNESFLGFLEEIGGSTGSDIRTRCRGKVAELFSELKDRAIEQKQMGTSRQIPNDFIYVRTRLSHTFFFSGKTCRKMGCVSVNRRCRAERVQLQSMLAAARRSENDFQFQS